MPQEAPCPPEEGEDSPTLPELQEVPNEGQSSRWTTVVKKKSRLPEPKATQEPPSGPREKGFPRLQDTVEWAIQNKGRRARHETLARITVTAGVTNPHTNLAKIFNPAKNGIKITNLRQIGPATLLASAATKEDVEKLADTHALKDGGYSVDKVREKLPRIVIYDTPLVTDADIREEIYAQNPHVQERLHKEEFMDQSKKISHWSGRRSAFESNWVLEVSPGLRKTMMEKAGRIYLGWTSCRVADYFDAVRCFRCQRYGHVAKHCTHMQDTCGHCGDAGHRFPSCMKRKDPPVCTTCKIRGAESNHNVNDRRCPTRQKALRERIMRTSYV